MIKISLITAILAVALIFVGCKGSAEKDNTDNKEKSEKVGGTSIRKSDLMSENVDLGEMAVTGTKAPGSGETIDRSFENAPPMIPHTTEGFLPITIKSNQCLTCHMPNVAKAMKATPLPQSHFTDYRIAPVKKGGKYHIAGNNETSAKNLKNKLNSARYNCSQCHVALTNATVVVKNNFKADFRSDDAKKHSNLDKKMNEGVK